MITPARLAFLLDTVELEAGHLLETDQRLFAAPFDPDRAAALRTGSTNQSEPMPS